MRAADKSDETRVGDRVAPEHPPWLLEQAEQPLETEALPGAGARRVTPAMTSIEPPTPMTNGTAEVRPVLAKEVLLARAAHRDEQDVGAARADLVAYLGSLVVREIAVARSRHLQSRYRSRSRSTARSSTSARAPRK